MNTLDSVVAGRKLARPILLKVDVQGYQLEVLSGQTRHLNSDFTGSDAILHSGCALGFTTGDTTAPTSGR
jgi:hypothetical protein